MSNTGSDATIVTLNLYVITCIVFANGGVQEALVNEAFPSLFIKFRTFKRPQSLVLRIYILNPNDAAK